MKRLHGPGLLGMISHLCWWGIASLPRITLLLALLFATGWSASAQSVMWTDSFIKAKNPTPEQCGNWSSFLDQLKGRSFASVTFSGSNSPEGKTLNDPAAATALAALLGGRKAGSVTAPDGATWAVTICGSSACGGPGVALSVTSGTPSCSCNETYSVRPYTSGSSSLAGRWGGLNSGGACMSVSQSMTVEFQSGAYITTPSTILCKNDKVVLQANSNVCSGPYTYVWSNGQTGEFVEVSEPGEYSVTVFSSGGNCSAVSDPITITPSDIAVTAVADKLVICGEEVQLTATGTSSKSGSIANKFCVYDAKGGDCTFTELCTDLFENFGSKTFSQDITVEQPEQIDVNIYYALSGPATFVIKLNGQVLGSYTDAIAYGSCASSGAIGQYPRNFSYALSEFESVWSNEGPNNLEVEIQAPVDAAAPEKPVLLGGIVAEVLPKTAFYSWAPADYLTDTSIANPVATPPATTTYMVTYTDANNCQATAEVKVEVACPPIAVCKDAVELYAGADCEAKLDPMQIDAGSSSPQNLDLTYSLSAESLPVGTTDVTLTVTDPNHKTASCVTAVTVINVDPVINSIVASASTVDVNTPVTLTVNATDQNISHATIDWGDLSAVETVETPESVFDVSHTYSASGSYSTTVTVIDMCGKSTFEYESIVVLNQTNGTVSGGGWFASPRGAYFKSPRSSGKATFAFDVTNETSNRQAVGHIVFNYKDARIKFRSSDIEMFTIAEETAAMKALGKINGTPGYQILISVVENQKHDGKDEWDKHDDRDGDDDWDKDGDRADNWDSRNGRYDKHDDRNKNDHRDKDKEKKSKDKKDNSGKHKKDIDHIRVKIWDPTGNVIYDTQFGAPDDAIATTPIGGGSINVDEEKSGFNKNHKSPVASSYGQESTSAYPNPFKASVDLQYNSASPEDVVIQILDLSGRVVFNQAFPASEDGNYALDVFEDGKGQPGIYIAVIKQGRKVEFLRLVHQ